MLLAVLHHRAPIRLIVVQEAMYTASRPVTIRELVTMRMRFSVNEDRTPLNFIALYWFGLTDENPVSNSLQHHSEYEPVVSAKAKGNCADATSPTTLLEGCLGSH